MAAVAKVSLIHFKPVLPLTLCHRIFRTDYGHTEVAAHFGNGEQNEWYSECFAHETAK